MPDARAAPRASTGSAKAASAGPLSLAMAPPKIHGWRLAMTRSFPDLRTRVRRRLKISLCIRIIRPMARQAKRFLTDGQEEVYRQVKSYLDELVDEHFDDAEH